MGESHKLDPKIQQEIRAYRAFLARLDEQPPPEAAEPPDVAALGDRYLYVLENLRAMTVDVAADGRVAFASPSVTTVLGYGPEELVGIQGIELIHPDDLEALAATARQLRESCGPFRGTYRARHKQGHWVWLEASVVRNQPPRGPAVTVIFARDVGEVKRASDALLESEDRFRSLTEHASDIISEVDSDGRIRYVSPSFEAVLGRKPEEILGKTFGDAGIADNLHPEDVADLVEHYQRGLGAGEAVEAMVAHRFRHADGTWHWFESQTTPYRTSSGELRKVVVSRDVTERVQAEAELRESEERYRLLAETTRDMIVEMDDEGRILYASPGTRGGPRPSAGDAGGNDGVHARSTPTTSSDNVDAFLAALKEEGPVRSEPYRVRHRDGSWRWVEAVGVPYRRADGELRLLSVSHDITERRHAEEQRREFEERMRQAQKLEGLGVMAGGIAHDFNNLLTPILGNASLALLDLPTNSPARERIEKIRKAALRAAALTNQMLAYAGAGPVAVEPLDLSRRRPRDGAAARELDLGPDHRRLPAGGEPAAHRGGRRAARPGGDEPAHERGRGRRRGRGPNRDRDGHHPDRRLERAPDAARRRPAGGDLRLPRGERHRLRHGRRHPLADLRPLLHHQVHRPRPRARGGAGNRARAPRRHRDRQRARPRHALPGAVPERERGGQQRTHRSPSPGSSGEAAERSWWWTTTRGYASSPRRLSDAPGFRCCARATGARASRPSASTGTRFARCCSTGRCRTSAARRPSTRSAASAPTPASCWSAATPRSGPREHFADEDLAGFLKKPFLPETLIEKVRGALEK